MFNHSPDETMSRPETVEIPQAQIDEAITLDIYQSQGLVREDEVLPKIDALREKAIIRYIRDRFGVDPSGVIEEFGVYSASVSPEQNVRLRVSETYSDLNQQDQIADLTISLRVSLDGDAADSRDHIMLNASASCVQSILRKLQEREDERDQREQAERAQFERLLPSAIEFARQHPFERLNGQECAPIAQFIDVVLGGALQDDETLKIVPRDWPSPAWEFRRCRGERILDVHQFPEESRAQ